MMKPLKRIGNDWWVDIHQLSISNELKDEIELLIDWYQKAYDFDHEGSYAEWNYGYPNDFYEFTNMIYERLCKELGPEYEIISNYQSQLDSLVEKWSRSHYKDSKK